MDYIDLHTHSTASDGSFTPAEVFASAVDLQLAAVGIVLKAERLLRKA